MASFWPLPQKPDLQRAHDDDVDVCTGSLISSSELYNLSTIEVALLDTSLTTALQFTDLGSV